MLRTYSASMLAALIAAIFPSHADAQILSLTLDDALLNLDSRVTLLNGQQTYLDGQITTVGQAVTAAQSTANQATVTAAAAAAQAAANLTSLDVARARIDSNSADLAILTSRANAADAAAGTNSANILTLQQQAAAGATADQDHANAVATLTGRMNAGDGADQAQNAALTTLHSRVTAEEATSAESATRMTALDSRVANNEAGTAANRQDIEALETRHAEHGERLAAQDERDDRQDDRLTEFQQWAERIDDTSTTHNQSLAKLHEQTTSDRERVTAIDTRTATHQGRLDDHGQRLDAMAAADAAFRERLANGETGLVRHDALSGKTAIAGDKGGTMISVAGVDGARRVNGVAEGQEDTDATNLGQVRAMQTRTIEAATAHADRAAATMYDAAIAGSTALIDANNVVLRKEMRAVAAGTAALAGLPQAIMPGRGMVAAGIGGQDGQISLALGVGKSFRGRHAPVLRAGAAMGAGGTRVSYNAAVGFHF